MASPVSTAVPTQPSASPAVISTDAVHWRELDGARGLGEVLYVDGVVSNGSRLVAYGEVGQTEFDGDYTFWFSDNGTDWTAVKPPDDGYFAPTIYGLAVTPTGSFIAVSDDADPPSVPGTDSVAYGVVFQSADGQHWTRSRISVNPAWEVEFGLVDGQLVMSDFLGSFWTSIDGREWTAISPGGITDAGADVLLASGNELFAFTQHRTAEQTGSIGPIQVWRTADGATWQKVSAEFGASDEPRVSSAATNGRTSVLLLISTSSNDRRIWLGTNGEMRTPQSAPRGAREVVSTSAGFVAFGQCAWAGAYQEGGYEKGVLWVSPDGSTWTYVDQSEPGWSPQVAFEWQGQLVVLGSDDQRYMANRPAGAVWLVDLPEGGQLFPDKGTNAPASVCDRGQ